MLEVNHTEIFDQKLAVFVIDECQHGDCTWLGNPAVPHRHLMGGDICGYGWGDRQEIRTVDVKNYRERQTYYGAVDLRSARTINSKSQNR